MVAGPKKAVHPGDRVRLVAHCKDKAPLEANWQQVLVEVVDTSSSSERSGLDLVAVLDVSGSMEGDKLNKLKRAMNFVIGKLGPMDRLSIISFSTKAEKLCPLRVMSEAAKEKLKDDIVEKRLTAGGYTNMRDGLLTGLRVLAERRDRGGGRVSSIVFMSDGVEYPEPPLDGGATGVDVGHVAVFTFGFGEDHDAKARTCILSSLRPHTSIVCLLMMIS
jgi:Mg-chelatase subunit ChlD